MEERSAQMGFNPVTVNAITYIGTLAIFMVAMFVPGIKLPFPLVGCLVEWKAENFGENQNLQYFFLSLWSVHFLRRTIEVLFVHEYKRKMPLVESIGAPVYYWFFSFWNGVALRHDNGYHQTYLPMLVVGSLLFFTGSAGNCKCHLQLRDFRKQKRKSVLSEKSKHTLPYGFIFEYVSCPHYLFEILTWIGFLLTAWTLSSLLFLLATIATLVTYSYKKHGAYKQEFNGQDGRELYPRNRKALIPYIF